MDRNIGAWCTFCALYGHFTGHMSEKCRTGHDLIIILRVKIIQKNGSDQIPIKGEIDHNCDRN